MKADCFNQIFVGQLARCEQTLSVKAGEYADDRDRLANFKKGAALKGITVREALSGMMLKHTVSVYDMCAEPKLYDDALWDEKITDHINYLILLRAIVADEREALDGPNKFDFPIGS